MERAAGGRDRQIQRVILIEGAANAAVFAVKASVGLTTGSLAVLSDALHSLTDLANNAVALLVVRMSAKPPDAEHPYGHRRFETLAVFMLATLLTVLAVELALGAWGRRAEPPATHGMGLVMMLAVLCVNAGLATWQSARARQLHSDILRADARHTLADVLTTIAVIVGWQLSVRGYPWLDTVCALGVSAVVFTLALGLFRRTLPVLAGRSAVEPERISRAVARVPGVRGVGRVRSRWEGSSAAADLVVRVGAHLSTEDSHAIADEVEGKLRRDLHIHDVTVHIEPHRD